MRILTPPGVYRPRLDSRMLTDALREADLGPGSRLLDLCTGNGILAVNGALLGAHATAVDVSRRAVLATGLNARVNGVSVRALRGSLFAPVTRQRFDCIVSNPPYVPSSSPTAPRRGRARAWDAGLDGRLLLDRICTAALDHLRPGGTLMLVHSALIDEQRTLELLTESGLDATVVDRRTEPLGPIMTERARQGLLPDGVGADELVVIRAAAPFAVAPALRRPPVAIAETA